MKIRFAADVLNDPNAWDLLDQIVHHFITERHFWDINDIDDIENSDWIQEDIQGRAGKRNIETLRKCYTGSIYPDQSKMHRITLIITLQGGENALTPDAAIPCLNEPANVVVENQTSDGAFIDAMIHAFGRNKLREAQTKKWWKYVHLGGFGEIEKRVEYIRTNTMDGPLRVFVLTDSDRRYPGEETKTVKKVEEYCGKVGDVKCAILQKRKIENYLPIAVLLESNVPRKSENIWEAFINLTPEQQNHYEMKKGFKKDKETGHAIIPEEQKTLFQGVSQHILDNLCGGFGSHIWEYFDSARDVITKEAMTTVDPDKQIEQILDSIESLL